MGKWYAVGHWINKNGERKHMVKTDFTGIRSEVKRDAIRWAGRNGLTFDGIYPFQNRT